MGNDQQTKNNSQKGGILFTEDPQKIEELERKLEEKNQEIDKIKQAELTIKTDLTKGVINQSTFKHNFKNGYADGRVAEQKKKILADRKKAKVGIK